MIIEMNIENYGTIKAELYPEFAPKTVENFLALVDKGFYDGLIFHRVIHNFMIQGGDPTGTGMGGAEETIPGEFLSNGYKNPLKHSKGVLSMARSQNYNSASSQFFICQADCFYLDGEYAAFGKVTEGLDIVDLIAKTDTDQRDRPLNDVVIHSIKRV
ncbi:MAG: peptidylprolyl isomerase [Clostridiales bacterium]|nr:peptidylprolyl isomerase [Clostridiales bacterium]